MSDSCKRYRRADGSARYVWIDNEGNRSQFSCNSWRCDQCRPKITKFLKWRIGNWAEEYKLTRFWTFTLARKNGYLSPEQIQKFTPLSYSDQLIVEKAYHDMMIMGRNDSEFAFSIAEEYAKKLRLEHARKIIKEARRRINRRQLNHYAVNQYRKLCNRYLSYVWNKWRTATKRKYGNFSYIRISEHHKDAVHPHIHCLVSEYIPWAYVRRTWDSYGGGEQVYVEYVDDIRRVSSYVAKYISKASETPAEYWPDHTRHVTTSRDIKLKLTPKQYGMLQETEEQEGVRCPYAYSSVQLASEGFQKCQKCIFRKHCGIVLPPIWELYHNMGPVLPRGPDEVINDVYHMQDIKRMEEGKKPNNLWKWSV